MGNKFVFSKKRYIRKNIGIVLMVSVILSIFSLIVVYNQGKLDLFITFVLLAFYFGLSLLIMNSKSKVKVKSSLTINNERIRYEDVKVDGYVSSFFIKKYRSDVFSIEKIENVTVKRNCIIIIGNGTKDFISSSDGNRIQKRIGCKKVVIPRCFEPDSKLIEVLEEFGRKSL